MDKIYVNKILPTTLHKRTLKKLILDSCTKNTFTFNGDLYEQVDGVSMGSSLGPVLANIIMADLERNIIEPLLQDGTLKFYARYVDDTLVLIKPSDVSKVVEHLNSYHKNLKFTVDNFENDVVHFLDILITNNQTDVYYKDTHSAQYTHFSSYTPWRLKTAWINALYHRAQKICSNKKLFSKQLSNIVKFMSWNGYPKHIRHAIINRLKGNKTKLKLTDDDDIINIYVRLPFAGLKGEQLFISTIRKMKRFLKPNVKFKVTHETKKVSFFVGTKDKVPLSQKHSIVYKITCPGCGEQYVGKTDCCVIIRMTQHGTKSDQPMYQHFLNCTHFQEMYHLLNICTSSDITTTNASSDFMVNSITQNYEIIGMNRNWSQLLFLESLMIKRHRPVINDGLKFTRELELFR